DSILDCADLAGADSRRMRSVFTKPILVPCAWAGSATTEPRSSAPAKASVPRSLPTRRAGLEVLSAKSDIMKISPSNEVKQSRYCATKQAARRGAATYPCDQA